MNILRIFFSIVSLFIFLNPVHSEQAMEAGLVNPGYEEKPDWFKNSFLDLREDIAEATANSRRVILYFYQDGCPYCARLLQDNFTQKNIVSKTRKHFDVISINMWGDREVTNLAGETVTEKAFARSARVMFTPTLLLLNEKGQIALRINGYYAPHKFEAALDYVSQHLETKQAFMDYFRQQAPERASGLLHDEPYYLRPPYNLSSLVKNKKPLLVKFEQKHCPACDEAHKDVYKRKQTVEQFARFNIVRLDMWSETPLVDFKGKKTTAIKLAKQLDVKYTPTMVFFDDKGREIFRAEAYLKAFHTQSVLDYIASGAYKTQPEFQRYISERADKLEAQGIHVDIWR